MPCLKFVRVLNAFKKKNTYTLYVTRDKPHKPVRFVMHGYDVLLHSFYDHYVLDYLTFHSWQFDAKTMEIPEGESDQFQISPAASPGILRDIVWRTWLFIAYSDER